MRGKPARLVDAQIPPDRRSGVDVATLRQPVLIRGWQLLVFPPFYEAMGPRHAALTPLSPSKPERPHTIKTVQRVIGLEVEDHLYSMSPG